MMTILVKNSIIMHGGENTMMDNDFEKLKGYVRISSYRYNTMKVLSREQVKIPKQISYEAHIRKNHISKILRDLKEHGLVECINEESRKGRLYRLTILGEQVQKEVIYYKERYVLSQDGKVYDNRTDKEYDITEVVRLLNNQNETISEYYNIILSP